MKLGDLKDGQFFVLSGRVRQNLGKATIYVRTVSKKEERSASFGIIVRNPGDPMKCGVGMPLKLFGPDTQVFPISEETAHKYVLPEDVKKMRNEESLGERISRVTTKWGPQAGTSRAVRLVLETLQDLQKGNGGNLSLESVSRELAKTAETVLVMRDELSGEPPL